jgi:hypothetical protein
MTDLPLHIDYLADSHHFLLVHTSIPILLASDSKDAYVQRPETGYVMTTTLYPVCDSF